MFEGFEDEYVDVGEVRLRVRHGGSGPAVLLVHGHPRTGATWHRVAPQLVDRGYSVVCPDMRGYGSSECAPILDDHAQQSQRAVADDLVALMTALEHERFTAVGHDRGCYVVTRLALDHPDRLDRLVVMDGVPTLEALERCDAKFAHDWYHWFFYAQPEKPERAIMADPDRWYGGDPGRMGQENYEEDRSAGRRITRPTLFLWSSRDDMEDLYGDPLAIWRDWTVDVTGHPIESGHHMAEENPDDLVAALAAFVPTDA